MKYEVVVPSDAPGTVNYEVHGPPSAPETVKYDVFWSPGAPENVKYLVFCRAAPRRQPHTWFSQPFFELLRIFRFPGALIPYITSVWGSWAAR